MRAEQEIENKVVPRTTPFPVGKEDMMFVALGRDVKESETLLMWALHNSREMKICILHVHRPAQKTTMMGGKVSINLMKEHLSKESHHEIERQQMHKTLDKYIRICDQAGVKAEKACIELDSIEKGIVQLISDHGIKWLVIGAAANKSYSRNMKEPKSKKAIHVCKEAPRFCHIWFVCKGNLIHTRESKIVGVNTETVSPLFRASPITEAQHSLKPHSIAEGVNSQRMLRNLAVNYRRVKSDTHGMLASNPEGSSDWVSLSKRSPSVGSYLATCSSSEVEDQALIPFQITKWNKMEAELPIFRQADAINVNGELYDKLKQFVAESESSRKEAYDESVRRKKSEKNVVDAILKAKEPDTMYAEELKRRKEFEEAVARGKEEAHRMKMQLGDIMEELRLAREEKFSLESRISDTDKMVDGLERTMSSAVEFLQKYKKERDELQVTRDNAVRVLEELRGKQAEDASSSSLSQFFLEFSFLEIEEATSYFSEDLKIGEGGYRSIYRGRLRHTEVAVKVLHSNNPEGPLEFQQEVNILSKLRHPNIITLIGACPEAWALICEYLPNGSLEDRLNCRNNTPPLLWKTRLRIAAELCSALVFIHSCRPQGIVHGNLKPANILLDANFVSKLSDFGTCWGLQKDKFSKNNTILCHKTNPKGTFLYMDPEFFATGELTLRSDVYSFGIILLRLLTGKPALGITREVRFALDKGDLKDLLDPTAGDWPFVQAKQLAHLALSCSDMNRKGRPDLACEVWRVLENMKVSCGVSCLRFRSAKGKQAPAYFVCPIFQVSRRVIVWCLCRSI
ncbi:hypothetical protein OROGR_030058 [Orobanche gracilis]